MKPEYVRATVSGEAPMRDVLTRESVPPGGEVTLLVRRPGQPLYRCPRHPRRGVREQGERCLCHATVIEFAVEQGFVTGVRPFDPDAPAAPAAKPVGAGRGAAGGAEKAV